MEESVFEPDNVSQLDEWIEAGKDLDISHESLCLKVREGDLITPFQTLICRYYYALVPFIVEKTLTQEEYIKYKNNPKLLSQDLYETPELWSAILYINNCVSIADFKKEKIKVFEANIISKLEELLVLSEEDMTKNRLSIESE